MHWEIHEPVLNNFVETSSPCTHSQSQEQASQTRMNLPCARLLALKARVAAKFLEPKLVCCCESQNYQSEMWKIFIGTLPYLSWCMILQDMSWVLVRSKLLLQLVSFLSIQVLCNVHAALHLWSVSAPPHPSFTGSWCPLDCHIVNKLEGGLGEGQSSGRLIHRGRHDI